MIHVYTDGSKGSWRRGNCGGWAYIILDDQRKIARLEGKSVCPTTNNRMELTAILEALKAFSRSVQCKVYSDSKYCVNLINNWMHWWQRNGWKRKNDEPVMNLDLIQQIYTLKQTHTFDMIWVKGHNGCRYNELVDEISRKCRVYNEDTSQHCSVVSKGAIDHVCGEADRIINGETRIGGTLCEYV